MLAKWVGQFHQLLIFHTIWFPLVICSTWIAVVKKYVENPGNLAWFSPNAFLSKLPLFHLVLFFFVSYLLSESSAHWYINTNISIHHLLSFCSNFSFSQVLVKVDHRNFKEPQLDDPSTFIEVIIPFFQPCQTFISMASRLMFWWHEDFYIKNEAEVELRCCLSIIPENLPVQLTKALYQYL